MPNNCIHRTGKFVAPFAKTAKVTPNPPSADAKRYVYIENKF